MIAYLSVAVAAVASAGVSGIVTRYFAKEAPRRSPARALAAPRGARSTIFDVFAVFVLVALAGMRATSVGTDTAVYASLFDGLPTSDWSAVLTSGVQEPGYVLLSAFVKAIGGDFTVLLWVMATISVVSSYWALKRASRDFWYSLALYILLGFYLLQFNAMRQGVAVSLILLGATFLGKRRGWIPYVALGLVAMSFHVSAVVVLVLLPVFSRWRVTGRSLLVTLVIAFVVAAGLWANPWVARIVDGVNPRYAAYLDWQVEAGLGIFLVLAARCALLVYALWLKPAVRDMRYAAWSTIGLVVSVLGTQSVIGSRLGSYFLVFLCILIPNVAEERRAPRTHAVIILTGAVVYFVFHLVNYADLIPYAVS